MPQSETLRTALIDEIKDLYHAEKQLTKALPKLAKTASHDELRAAFEKHLEETQEQVSRLEQVFDLLDEKPKAKPCRGMAGIIEEGSEIISELDKGPVLDACLIASAQRAEHYEIAAYGTVVAWAQALELDDVATLLQQTLEEEKATDEKLTSLAESDVNSLASAPEGEEAEEEEEEMAAPRMGARRSATPSGRAASASPARRRR